jgi:hypothetical protein
MAMKVAFLPRVKAIVVEDSMIRRPFTWEF